MVRVVAEGEALLAPWVTCRLIEQFVQQPEAAATERNPAVETLTDRELEVFAAVAGGLSNQELADELFISHATARRT